MRKILIETKHPGVVISTITFYPEISGTGQVLTELALSLRERGMEVHVYTAQPHYYEKHDPLPKHEAYKGIQIHRIFSTTLNKNNRIGRILNWSSFTLSAFFHLLFEKSPYPLLMVSSPPVLPFIGWLLKKIKRKPFILLVHDVYPNIGVKLGFFQEAGPTVRLWNFLNQKTYRSASKIVVIAEEMAQVVSEKMQCPRNGKIQVIHNWADEFFIKPIPKEQNLFLKENPIPYSFVVQYSGNLGFNHDLEPLLEAAKKMGNQDIGFLFIGEGGKKEKLQSMAASLNLKNIFFFPFQPREYLPYLLSASNLSVVTLEEGLEGLAVPSKFYSILASGRPVLAILGQDSEMARKILEYECGFVVSRRNPGQVAQILKRCLENPEEIKKMGKNARLCFEEHFTREKAALQYQELLLKLNP